MKKGDKRLERAADALEWAIRWFFHMWVSRGGGSRWVTYRKWKNYLKTCAWRKFYGGGDFSSTEFSSRVVGGFEWLVYRWFGISPDYQEKMQLEKMICRSRKQKERKKVVEESVQATGKDSR